MTQATVSETLISAFKDELQHLRFSQLDIRLLPTRGSLGSFYHRVTLAKAPNTKLSRIASEGEARALAVAAFFAELSTAAEKSAIIFDDPVSSLDHIWREKVADRLALESLTRQVIVFSHDIVLVLALKAAAARHGAEVLDQHLRAGGSGAGVAEGLPAWIALNTGQKIGFLTDSLQRAEALHKRNRLSEYDREALNMLVLIRQTWERAIEEVLLNQVVERYRKDVQTKRVKRIVDISEADYAEIERAMTWLSQWPHDQAPATASEPPRPEEIREQIEAIKGWVKQIRDRR